MIGNLRTIRTIGLAAAIGTASVIVAAGQASAASQFNGGRGTKLDCVELTERADSLTAQRMVFIDQRTKAQIEVAQLEPIVTYAEYVYGGFTYSINSQTAYIQHLIDIGAPAADIAAQQAELVRLTDLRDAQTPGIVALRQKLADARSGLRSITIKLKGVNVALSTLRQLMRSIGCPVPVAGPRSL
jgi:hypothetical protein